MRFRGTKYKQEVLRALQGAEHGGRDHEARIREGAEKHLAFKDYIWKRKENFEVKC